MQTGAERMPTGGGGKSNTETSAEGKEAASPGGLFSRLPSAEPLRRGFRFF
jgi:hypothetical protein